MPEVSGVRFGINAGKTRIVLDLNEPVAYSVQGLADPDRLIIDLEEVRWRLQPAVASRPRGIARAHRFGLLAPGRSRLVVDIARPFSIAQAVLLSPSRDSKLYRLVVDITPAKAVPAKPAPEKPAPATVVASRPDRTDGAPPSQPASPAANPSAPSASTAAPAAPAPTATPRPAAPLPVPRPAVMTAALEPVLPPVETRPPPQPVEKPLPPSAPAKPLVPLELPVVVIDPGHGGVDPGAIGVNGLPEKDLVLDMGRELRTVLERSGRYRVALTRDEDIFIRLRERITKAREAGGQLFISLHADSLNISDQRGASVYTLSETASDAEAARLAGQENKADILAGADLSHHDAVVATILIDLAQRDTNNKSISFADFLAEELAEVTKLVRRHRRFAGFAVLKSPDMPSVLLELGYLSNPEDARNLARPDYRAKLGEAILRSLDRYFAAAKS